MTQIVNVKKSKDGKWQVRNPGTGQWMTPVYLGAKIFYSMTEAGESIGMTAGAVSSAIIRGEELHGNKITLLTQAEANAVANELYKEQAEVVKKAAKRVTAKAAKNGKKQPFEGVKWDGGGATVRLAGHDWSMTRQRITDIPEEIRAHCTWKS